MGYRIVSPTADHVPRIARIWSAGWHDAHADIVPSELCRLRTDDSFVERAAQHASNTRIAVAGDDVLGFCMTKADELYQMYVSRQARGTGAAQALIADAEARMRAAGHDMSWLACAVGNDRAMRFYEKSGWINAGRETVQLDAAGGTFPLEVWRYEKRLMGDGAG